MRTNRFRVCIAAVALTLTFSAASLAQRPGAGQRPGGQRPGRTTPRQGGDRAGLMPLSVAQVPAAALATPLALTAAQKEKIEAIQTKLRQETREQFGQRPQGERPQGERAQGDRMARMQQLRELSTKATKEIEALLTAEQKEKLPALLTRLQTLRDVGVPLEVVADLKLTEEQQTKLEALAKETRAKMEEARADGANNQRPGELRQATRAKALEILTAEQKATLEKWQQENRQRQRQPQRQPRQRQTRQPAAR